MKKFIFAIGFLFLGLAACAGDELNHGNMRVSPIGYRVGTAGAIQAFDASAAVVSPSEMSVAVTNKPVRLTATLNRDYKAVCWQAFSEDPRIRETDPRECGQGSTNADIEYDPDVMWMYVVVVLEYDPERSVSAVLSSFGRGTVTVSPVKEKYVKGDRLTLSVQPGAGYQFVRWSDNNADPTRSLTVEDDLDLKAYVEPISSRVTFSPGSGAFLDVREKRVSYASLYGDLPVPTRTGGAFSGWQDAARRSVTSGTTVEQTADHTLYASWESEMHEIAWNATGPGNGQVEGAGTYAYGSQPTLTAVPYEGSLFVGWTDGELRNPRRITVLSNALYVAAFDVATYVVTFTYYDEHGNLVTTAPTNVPYGSAAIAPEAPNWPEHTFTKWSTEEYRRVMRDLSVEALYNTKTYSVAFAYRNWQGNCVTTMPQNVVAGDKATPPGSSVVDNWTGHTFKGWQPDYNVIHADTLCEALYETNVYTVTFSYCGANGEELQHTESVTHGEKVPFDYVEGVKNQWKGHTFVHWSFGGQAITDIGNVVATKDMRISAAYEGYARISYTGGVGGEGEMPTQVYTNYSGGVTLAPNAFTRTGYLFAGWSTDGSNNPCYNDQDDLLVTDGTALTLTACWAPITYQIRLDGNGGTCKVEPQTATYDKETVFTISNPSIGIEDLVTRPGFVLQPYWSRDALVTNEVYYMTQRTPDIVLIVSNLTVTAGETVTLYAVWRAAPQTVTINGKEVQIAYGEKLGQPDEPTPETGYAFSGFWTTNGADAVEFPITVTGSFSLDPLWKPITYKVAFHGTDGTYEVSGTMKEQPFEYDAEQALTSNSFTRTGYAFAGWAKDAALFTDGQSVKNLATTQDAVVDLYARWTPNAFTVHFNPTEGSGAMDDQAFTYDVAQELAANGFTAPDWCVFNQWTNAEGQVFAERETVSNLTAAAGGICNLYATWKKAPSYMVKFHPNGATGEPYVQTIARGVETALTANRFAACTGYAFAGWTDAEGDSTVKYKDGAKVMDIAAEGKTNGLYAVWTPNRYWVAFDGNGADGGGKMEAQEFAYGVAQKLADNGFTRTGHAFAGWATNATDVATYANGEVVSNLTAEADATNTLWATWTVNRYEITFDSAGGSAVGPVTNEYGAAVTEPVTTREGYSFAGWYEGDAAAPFDFSAMPARDVRLTAHWSDPNMYTIVFNGNGATGGSMAPTNVKYDVEIALPSNKFVRTGCGFSGWTNALGTAYADGAKVKNLSASQGALVMLYANWTAYEYDCTFVGKTEDNQKRKYGEKLDPRPAVPTKTGYTSRGWTTNGADVVNLETFTMPDHDVTFSPLRDPIEYTIAFDGNGATEVAMAPTNVKYDVEIALPSNTYVRSGYAFVKWTNALGRVYADGEKVKNLKTEKGTTETLYAVWQQSGNPLSIALGLPEGWNTTSVGNAWTMIGESTDGLGLQRSSTDKSAYLEIDIPAAGTLYMEFTYGKSSENTLVITLDDEDVKDDSGGPARYSETAMPTLTIEKAGKLRFKGVPDNGATWTLKNFKWEPEAK